MLHCFLIKPWSWTPFSPHFLPCSFESKFVHVSLWFFCLLQPAKNVWSRLSNELPRPISGNSNCSHQGAILWFATLRVRAFFHKTVRVCHVYCNFKIGFTCRITVIFGTLKDESLLINTLASNVCFSCRNMFQNGVDALSKIVDAFLSKSSKFHLVRIIR